MDEIRQAPRPDIKKLEANKINILKLAGIAVYIFVSYFLIRSSNTRELPNYLYNPALNLKYHIISLSSPQEKKVVLLGSSAVIGNNFPINSTLADYLNLEHPKVRFYNLGSMEGSVLTALIYLKQSLNYKVNEVVLGISPDLFYEGALGRPVIIKNSNLILEDIDQKHKKIIEDEMLVKSSFMDSLIKSDAPIMPPQVKLKIYTFLYNLKVKVIGPTFNSDIYKLKSTTIDEVLSEDNSMWNVLEKFISTCEKNKVKAYFYLEPQLGLDKSYGIEKFEKFKDKLRNVLMRHNMTYFDYSKLLSQEAINFMDFIHLTPDGNRKLAIQLLKDIKNNRGDNDPVWGP